MYSQQKRIRLFNKGEIHTKAPDIYNHKIMDKCVLHDLATQIKKDMKVIRLGIDDCNESINRTFSNTTKGITNLNNSIKHIETAIRIKDKNNNYMYDERFLNAINFDMNSDVDFNFNENYCCLSKIKIDNFTFDEIKTSNSNLNNAKLPYENNGITLTIEYVRKTEITCEYYSPTTINNIKFDYSSEIPIKYEIYSVEEGNYTLLSSGISSSSVDIFFNKISTRNISIMLYSNEVNCSMFVNYITGNLNTYKRTGKLLTKEIILDGSSTNLKVNVDSNSKENIKTYIGFINKDGNIKWNNGDTEVKFNLSNNIKKVIGYGDVDFGVDLGTNKKVLTLKENANKKSIKIKTGFGKWYRLLVRGAFMNEDLSMIDYKPNDVVERSYVDIDNYGETITAGDLIILEQNVICDKEKDILIPKILGEQVGDEDARKHLRYAIYINGERVNSFNNISDNFEFKLRKGTNEIQILVNLKLLNDDSVYKVKYFNYINMKEYSDNIYHKELKLASVPTLQNDLYRDMYAISNDTIVVNKVYKEDKFFITYDTIIDSDIHYNNYKGQYLKAQIMVTLFSDNNYNNIIINRISIKN